jgi:DNA-binding transcriptional regulator YiaG
MANLASVLKEEIRRLARSEAREVTAVSRRAAAQHRRDIAELKRKVTTLERKVALLEKRTWREVEPTPDLVQEVDNLRFSAKGLASRRKKLGLSGPDYARLAGVSTQTLYNWEQGRSKPRKEQLAKLAALRSLSKREALARLEQLA